MPHCPQQNAHARNYTKVRISGDRMIQAGFRWLISLDLLCCSSTVDDLLGMDSLCGHVLRGRFFDLFGGLIRIVAVKAVAEYTSSDEPQSDRASNERQHSEGTEEL